MTAIVPDWRSPEERFGFYVIREGELQLLATGDCHAAMGLAFGCLLEEGDLEEVEAIGVLDSYADPASPGEWLVNPFARRPR